jgi:hypothetical protein
MGYDGDMRASHLAFAVIAVGGSIGCTTLGPIPATTGALPMPAPRPGVELQVGLTPGYFLSSSVQQEPAGASVGQAAALIDAGSILGLPGLVFGGRYVGAPGEGGYPEPMLGYRRRLGTGDRFAASALVYGAHGEGTRRDASYEMTRAGLEIGMGARLTPTSKWVELHLLGSASADMLSASGRYCAGDDGRFGVDCPEPPDTPPAVLEARASGLYPAGRLGLALHGGRHLRGPLHGARLALDLAAGTMPRVESGEQRNASGYAALGLSLTLAFGAAD